MVKSEAASSVEFVVDDSNEVKVKVEVDARIEPHPRQICARLAAVWIVPITPRASSSSEDAADPSGTAYRTQALRPS